MLSEHFWQIFQSSSNSEFQSQLIKEVDTTRHKVHDDKIYARFIKMKQNNFYSRMLNKEQAIHKKYIALAQKMTDVKKLMWNNCLHIQIIFTKQFTEHVFTILFPEIENGLRETISNSLSKGEKMK